MGPISVAVSNTPDGKFEYNGFIRNKDGTPFLRYVPFDPAVINDGGVILLYYWAQYPFENHTNFFMRNIFNRMQSEMFGIPMDRVKSEVGSVMGPIHVVLTDDMLTVCEEPKKMPRPEQKVPCGRSIHFLKARPCGNLRTDTTSFLPPCKITNYVMLPAITLTVILPLGAP